MSMLREKTTSFAIRAVKLYRYLTEEKKEFILSKQFVRSATSIGANVHEAWNAQSRKDFAHKLNIALKEANETQYWLTLLSAGEYLSEREFQSIYPEALELAKILSASVKTAKKGGAETEK